MKSALKAGVALATLVGVIFGLTMVVFNVPTRVAVPNKLAPDVEERKPLVFFSATRHWDSEWTRNIMFALKKGADDLTPLDSANEEFPGFFEPDSKSSASFWFANRNPESVEMRLEKVTCATCSQGSLTAIPPAKINDMIQDFRTTAVSGVFGDPAAGAIFRAVSSSGAAANLFDGLEWQTHEFRAKDWKFTIPGQPTTGPALPQLGVLNLTFGTSGKTKIEADFWTKIVGSEKSKPDTLTIRFEVVEPIRVVPPILDIGEINNSTTTLTRDLFVYSSTRTADQLTSNQLSFDVSLPGTRDTSKVITTGTPVLLNDADRNEFAIRLSLTNGRPIRVLTVYRVPVTINPLAGVERLEIGAFDREIFLANLSADRKPERIQVKGTVRGEVGLSEGKEIDLGTFRTASGRVKSFELISDRPGLDLAVAKTDVIGPDGKTQSRDHVMVSGEVADNVLKVTVERKKREDPDRGYYTLKVTVPQGAHRGSFTNSFIVLEVKGPTPRRIRIPVKGMASD